MISCPCGYSGIATYVGGREIRPVRYFKTPRGTVEQHPGKRESSRLECPKCKKPSDAVEELLREDVRRYEADLRALA